MNKMSLFIALFSLGGAGCSCRVAYDDVAIELPGLLADSEFVPVEYYTVPEREIPDRISGRLRGGFDQSIILRHNLTLERNNVRVYVSIWDNDGEVIAFVVAGAGEVSGQVGKMIRKEFPCAYIYIENDK